MSVKAVKFNRKDQPEFFKELRKRVNEHFKETDKPRTANFAMKVKTVFMIALYCTPLILMVTGVVTSFWPVMGMWVLMSFGFVGIGLAVMHDANHGAYSKDPKVNKAVGFVLNIIGGYPANWRIQHNVLHHSFTNVEGYDEDIEKAPILKLSPHQPHLGIYRFQAFYAPLLYCILTLYWVLLKDFEQLVRYKEKNLLKGQGLTFKKALFQIIFHKSWYFAVTIALPIMVVGVWPTVIGFLIMHAIGGLSLAFVFQSAHVIQETEFYETDDNGSVENSWAIHQMKTTANFANGSRALSWYVGGLNYQIEHHLFPNICHVHYPEISKIVRETAEEYGVPYHEHKTFLGAVKSHFAMLDQLGSQNLKEAAA